MCLRHDRFPASLSPLSAGGAYLNPLRADPTRTLTLRNRFSGEMRARFRRVRSEMTKAVRDRDIFGLIERPAVYDREFEFRTDAGKMEAFIQFMNELEEKHVIGTSRGLPMGTGVGKGAGIWTDLYIVSAYKAGVRHAHQAMVKANLASPVEDVVQTALSSPIHIRTVENLYTRTFTELKGITDVMDQQLSRALSQGLLEGRGPKEIARRLRVEVDGITKKRAILLARTEVIRSHHVATMRMYESAGIEGVEIVPELNTAGDARVCPICAALEGRQYTLEEAWDVIPVHPLCRCMMIPSEQKEKE